MFSYVPYVVQILIPAFSASSGVSISSKIPESSTEISFTDSG